MQPPSPPRVPARVAIIGGTFSGNKGAASMLQAVIDRLPERAGDCRFAVLSAYPEQDRAQSPGGPVDVVEAEPVQVGISFVLACFARLFRALRLPWGWLLRTAMLRALRRSEVAVDVGGISFVDGRGPVVLAYNVMLPGIPLLLGVPTVKAAQAIGPVRTRANRLLAPLVLRRCARVFARGEQSFAHLRELGIQHAQPAADLAFTLALPEEARTAAKAWVDSGRETVTVVPSRVVEQYCREVHLDYVGLLASFTDWLVERGFRVLLVAHAARPGAPVSRMNDLPVTAAVHRRARASEHVVLVDEELSPHVLRGVIAGSAVVVTARFHAMVSALATCTPVVVTGWSHKYAEVLRAFDLEEAAIAYQRLSIEVLRGSFERAYEQRATTVETLRSRLPAVTSSAMSNLDAVADVLGR